LTLYKKLEKTKKINKKAKGQKPLAFLRSLPRSKKIEK